MDSSKLKTIVLAHTSKTLIKKTSIKRKKKRVLNKEDDAEADAKHSMELSSESDDDSGETRFSQDTSNAHPISKQERNLGSPVVIEALSDTLSAINIPEALCHNDQLKSKKEFTRNLGLLKHNSCPKEKYMANAKKRLQHPLLTPKKGKTRQRQMEVTDSNSKGSNIAMSPSPRKDFECTNIKFKKDKSLEVGDQSSSLNDSSMISRSNNSPQFYCLRNTVLFIMKKNAKFCFTGKLTVKMVYGAVTIYGSVINISSGPMEVYSPRGYSSIAIETSNEYPNGNLPDVWAMLFAEGVHCDMGSKLQIDIDGVKPGTAIGVLSNLQNNLTAFLNAFYPFRLFPSIKNRSFYSWTDSRRAELILQSNLHFGDLNCKRLIVDPCITTDVAHDLLGRWKRKETACALIAGGKSVGKSTTVRYLINSILPTSKMAVLFDVDPGQTECTPAGCISYSLIQHPLMGPNFTHLKLPVYQLYIGDVNVARCITRYVEGVKALVEKLLNCPTMSRLPIIVNTMGFTQGIGWDIALFTIKLIRPSVVVQIMSDRSKNNFSMTLSKEVVNEQKLSQLSWCESMIDPGSRCEHELLVIRSQAERKNESPGETWNMEPYQQRELTLISYLSDILRGDENFASRYYASHLTINEVVPYVVPFSSLCISLLRSSAPPTHALKIINGNIVALCGIDLANDTSEESEGASYPRVLTSSPLCACYGFGIVRGIDMERKEVFINTPLPGSVMQSVNYLVGCIPVPQTLLDLHQRGAPYTGGSDALPTSREPRRGYFRMRYGTTQSN